MIDLKQFCDDHLDGIDETDWMHVEQIIKTLEPFNKYSKKLQSETVTLSDFYGYWTILRIKVSKSEEEFSQKLLVQMNKYHDILIGNPTLIGAVYLDPRYQRGLGNEKSLAVKFLADLYEKIIKIEVPNDASAATENKEDNNHGDGSYDDLDQYLDACNSAYGSERTNSSNTQNARPIISNILNEFDGKERLSLTASILEYWKEKKNTHPELYKLASVVMAIPPTQTSVERAFSALALVVTSHRTKLGDECLQNILLIRLNYDLLRNYYDSHTVNDDGLVDTEEVNDADEGE